MVLQSRMGENNGEARDSKNLRGILLLNAFHERTYGSMELWIFGSFS